MSDVADGAGGSGGHPDAVIDRNREFLQFYAACRINDQRGFYTSRREQFDRAAGQGLVISAILLSFSTAAGALAGAAVGWATGWSAIATILPAVSTALTAYLALYAFEQQSKIYGDAARALVAVSRPRPSPETPEAEIAKFVLDVEDVFRQEQGQWGQLTAQIQITDQQQGG